MQKISEMYQKVMFGGSSNDDGARHNKVVLFIPLAELWVAEFWKEFTKMILQAEILTFAGLWSALS